MDKEQFIEGKIKSLEVSDWARYAESAEDIAFIHGLPEYRGRTVQDSLRDIISETITFGTTLNCKHPWPKRYEEEGARKERSRVLEVFKEVFKDQINPNIQGFHHRLYQFRARIDDSLERDK